MIAEIIPEAYDYEGSRTSNPNYKKRGHYPPTFPLGAFKSQPLEVKCESISDLRNFLKDCSYVSDEKQFGKKEYWMPPEDFEKERKGDCEDFAVYAWRQLTEMGYLARVVMGNKGAIGPGHAWVQFESDGRRFIMEPQGTLLGETMPRLSVIRHNPIFSITWNGEKMEEYKHEPRTFDPSLFEAAALFSEWAVFWGKFWIKNGWRIPFGIIRMPYRIIKARGKRAGEPVGSGH